MINEYKVFQVKHLLVSNYKLLLPGVDEFKGGSVMYFT